MKRITLIIAAALLSLSAGVTYAQQAESDAASMSELLELIRQGQARDSQEARQREARFTQERNQQQNLLNQARAERTRQENESARLEQTFEENQQRIITARQQLDERLGALQGEALLPREMRSQEVFELLGAQAAFLEHLAGLHLGVLDDQLYDVMLVDRFERIVTGVGNLFQKIVEVFLFHCLGDIPARRGRLSQPPDNISDRGRGPDHPKRSRTTPAGVFEHCE